MSAVTLLPRQVSCNSNNFDLKKRKVIRVYVLQFTRIKKEKKPNYFRKAR